MYASPTATAERLLIGSGDSSLYALELDGGEVVWKTAIGGAVRSTPAVESDAVYVGGGDGDRFKLHRVLVAEHEGDVYALARSNGKILWQREINEGIVSSPTVVDDVVYIASNDGHVYALDAT